MWKEASWPNFKHYPGISPEGLRKLLNICQISQYRGTRSERGKFRTRSKTSIHLSTATFGKATYLRSKSYLPSSLNMIRFMALYYQHARWKERITQSLKYRMWGYTSRSFHCIACIMNALLGLPEWMALKYLVEMPGCSVLFTNPTMI
jgi:hypothetical protein